MQGNLNIFKSNAHFPGISLEVDVTTVSEKIALLALTFALDIMCRRIEGSVTRFAPYPVRSCSLRLLRIRNDASRNDDE